MIGKYLGLWALGQVFTRTPALRHYIGDITALLFLAIGGGILFGALLIGFFYGGYLMLTELAGLGNAAAFAITWLSAVAILMLTAAMVYVRIRRIMKLADAFKRLKSPFASILNPIVDSFLEGVNGEAPTRPAAKNAAWRSARIYRSKSGKHAA